MNSLRFNGGTLNGSRVVAALALIACTATANVSAEVTYVHSSVATIVAGASFTASSTRNQFGSSSDFVGNAYFLAMPSHRQSASGSVVGSANLIGYSLRYIGASAEFLGTATASFVPASSFGSCSFVATAGINAVATKVQFGKGNAVGEGFVSLTEPVVIRYVMGNVVGSVGLHAETGINGIHEAYANPSAFSSVSISDTGLVIKQVGALITGQAFVTSAETYTYSAKSSVVVSSAIVADPVLITDISGHVVASASLIADVTYFIAGNISLIGSSSVTNTGISIKHAAIAQNAVNTVEVIALATRVIPTASSVPTGTASISAKGSFIYSSGSTLITACLVEAAATVKHASYSDIAGSVMIVADPIVPVPFRAYADIAGSANLIALSAILRSASANFVGSGFLYPIGYTNLMAPVAASRTFTRPKRVRDFVRPAGTQTFKR